MKVDAKIVPAKVKNGLFSKKDVYLLRHTIYLTEVEKAQIIKSGLQEYVYLAAELPPEQKRAMRSETLDFKMKIWLSETSTNSPASYDYDTLVEAQVDLQKMKKNLAEIKQLMETSIQIGTEDSFEL